MGQTASLRVLRQRLHLSYSQIHTYLGCSLRYSFHYVYGLAPESVSSSLLLGTAVHSALAQYFERLQQSGQPEQPDSLLEFFRETLKTQIAQSTLPVNYKSEAPHAEALIDQGVGLLKAFVADAGFAGYEVVAVELPLATRLLNPDSSASDFDLVGAIDLLLRAPDGQLLAIDHKTAKTPYTQLEVDQDLQLSAYALLLRSNGYLAADQPLRCGFNVLRKLKTPKIERHQTLRTPEHSARFSRLAHAVLSGIEAQTYLPCPGWLCSDCPFKQACQSW